MSDEIDRLKKQNEVLRNLITVNNEVIESAQKVIMESLKELARVRTG